MPLSASVLAWPMTDYFAVSKKEEFIVLEFRGGKPPLILVVFVFKTKTHTLHHSLRHRPGFFRDETSDAMKTKSKQSNLNQKLGVLI